MLGLICVWAALLAALVVFGIGRPSEGGALTLAYFLGLSLLHVPGALASLGTVDMLAHRELTETGFEITVIGMAAFMSGAMLARAVDVGHASSIARPPNTQAQILQRIGWRALTTGALAYFVLLPLSSLIPSTTPLVSALATLLILGLWLVLYGEAQKADRGRLPIVIVLLPVLPIATLVNGGFIGYGIYWALSVLAFLFVIARQRVWFYVASPLAVYLGLSLFVTYMGQRTGIREVVWERQAGLFERLDRVSTIVTKFETLDLGSPSHVTAIDDRLNQNVLVGLAVERLATGWADFAYGATLPVWVLVPRALWPDKPMVGGGGTLVSDFTGISFATGTSVGAGQVFEFYVNFGTTGVVAGFLFLGFVLMRLDLGIMRSLASDDSRGVLLRALPGLALLQPGGNLREILVAVLGAIFVAYLLVHVGAFRFLRGTGTRTQEL